MTIAAKKLKKINITMDKIYFALVKSLKEIEKGFFFLQ